ncbi:hypothetical protein [Leptospira hartskeerlii]|nr:hypothetical protein [Leptospira hartskeerlii]
MSILVSAPDGIYLYATNTSYNGKLAVLGTGSLDPSLNFICGQQRIFSNIIDTKCSKYAPLVSTSLTPAASLNTSYSDFPTTGVPIRGPFGTIIAQDYANLFAVDLEDTMVSAGIADQTVWSFSDGNGVYDTTNNCSNGDDDGSLSTFGSAGSTALKNQASWFNTGTRSCSELHSILCLCYVPTSGG